MSIIVALVGMTGSGKSEVTTLFAEAGYQTIRFGDLTEEEIHKRGLEQTPETERLIREDLRKTHGMAAFATLNIDNIKQQAQTHDVVIDGLYSWSEYIVLKEAFGSALTVVAVYASPRTRYLRLASRPIRPLTHEEASQRDSAEVENIQKGGPIAMADITIVNEGEREDLRSECKRILTSLESQS